MVTDADAISIKLKSGCDAILDGYMHSRRASGDLIVLAESEQKPGKRGGRRNAAHPAHR
jgi:hypothetical protein